MNKQTPSSVLETGARVSAAIEAMARGEIVVVSDDDDRENEGDLFVAASLCTPEKMAFIIRHTSGIVCAPVGSEDARRLRLDPMVSSNDAPLGTAFTVSVDFRHGLTTGISGEERTNTVRAIANGNTGANDFVRPGHVFPLIAKDGGVLMRSGHTEACIDLCRLAGLPGVGVLAELMNDDGTVMRGKDVQEFRRQDTNMKFVSIADLISYRQSRDKLVERVGEFPVATSIGELKGYAYRTPFDQVFHVAVVHGRVGDGKDVLVRLHRANLIDDVFGKRRPIHEALTRFEHVGRGVIIFLRDGTAGVPVTALPQDGSSASEEARTRQWREIGLGAQILRDLGISSIRLLTSARHRYVGLAGFGIEITGTEPLGSPRPASCRRLCISRQATCCDVGSDASQRFIRRGTIGHDQWETDLRMVASRFLMLAGATALLALGGVVPRDSAGTAAPMLAAASRKNPRRPMSMSNWSSRSMFPYSMDPDEQALQREGYIVGLTSPEFLNAPQAGHAWPRRHHLFRMGGRAIRRSSCRGASSTAWRRPRRWRTKYRGSALPPLVSYLDFRGVALCGAAVRHIRISRHPACDRRIRRRRQQSGAAGNGHSRRTARARHHHQRLADHAETANEPEYGSRKS